MGTFFLFGKYSVDAVSTINAARTEHAAELVKSRGGEIKQMYTLLGEHDLVLIVELPSVEEAMRTSIELSRLTGISFDTNPALSVDAFDDLMNS